MPPRLARQRLLALRPRWAYQARGYQVWRPSQYGVGGRVSDRTAFFTARPDETTGDRTGLLVEFDRTTNIFANPNDKRTEDYISGRFG